MILFSVSMILTPSTGPCALSGDAVKDAIARASSETMRTTFSQDDIADLVVGECELVRRLATKRRLQTTLEVSYKLRAAGMAMATDAVSRFNADAFASAFAPQFARATGVGVSGVVAAVPRIVTSELADDDDDLHEHSMVVGAMLGAAVVLVASAACCLVLCCLKRGRLRQPKIVTGNKAESIVVGNPIV